MTPAEPRRVRVLVNRKSGLMWSFDAIQRAFDRHWESRGIPITYQFTQGVEDGRAKARQAIADGVDLLLVVGGDGSVHTVGTQLVGTDVCLGIIPAGSGNGFARHFNIPLSPERAVRALASARPTAIDVGIVNDRPFFVTCSMAWDAAVVRAFEKSPVRGIVPYVFAGVYEFFEYRTHEIRVTLDSGEGLRFADPLVFTIANLSQYGGGAVIAPGARPDDGLLELIVARRQDVPHLLANVGRLLSGDMQDIPQVVSRRFRELVARRAEPEPIQVDGELVAGDREVRVRVQPRALTILAP